MTYYLIALVSFISIVIYFLARLGENIASDKERDEWLGVMVVLTMFLISLIFALIVSL